MANSIRIAQTVSQAFAALNPDEWLPSGDPRYVPLDAGRGTRNLAADLTQRLLRIEEGYRLGLSRQQFACFLVTGHRGCGKTTELNRLRDRLLEEKFAVVFFHAEEELNLQAVEWWNVLLEIAWQLDDQLKAAPYHITIPDVLLESATEWLARVITKKTTRTDMEASLTAEFRVEAGLPFLAKAKAAIKALVSGGSSTVKEIQQEAERRPNTLRDDVNRILQHARAGLEQKGWRNLVIIVDGLEKIPLRPLAPPTQLTTHNSLFIYNGDHLKAPECHLVYTMPVSLLRDANVTQVFPRGILLLPMLHVRNADGTENLQALRLLTDVVKQRADWSLFAPGVVKRLALASGGHIRHFLYLLAEASLTDSPRVSLRDAERAIGQLVDYQAALLRQEYLPPLHHVAQTHTLPGSTYDGELTYHLLVLGYQNQQNWFDVHPCVKEASLFQRYIHEQESPTQPVEGAPGARV